jgi:hypothetical protein
MDKEDIINAAQLLTGIKDELDNLENALKKKDAAKLGVSKKKILDFQSQIATKL